MALRDVLWQRHARGDILQEGQVSASAPTARRQSRGTRAHPVDETRQTPVARGSTSRNRENRH